MKICFLAPQSSIHTKRWVKTFQERGHDVLVLTFHPDPPDAVPSSWHVKNIKPPFFSNSKIMYPFSAWAAWRAIRKWKPDIVQAHYATSYGLVAAMSGFHPLIITAWGSDVLVAPRSRIMRALLRFSLSRADSVSGTSKAARQAILKLGIPENKVWVTSLGPNRKYLTGLPLPTSLEVDNSFIVSARNHEPNYNIDLIIKAFAAIAPEFPGTNLLLAGSGPLTGELQQLASSLDVQHRITFGAVSHEQLLTNYFGPTRIYVSLPDSDAASSALMESMGRGCFPVLSDIPSNREFVTNGSNGFLCEREAGALAEKLRAALNAGDLRLKAATNNIELIRDKYTWEYMIERVEERYNGLTGKTAKYREISSKGF